MVHLLGNVCGVPSLLAWPSHNVYHCTLAAWTDRNRQIFYTHLYLEKNTNKLQIYLRSARRKVFNRARRFSARKWSMKTAKKNMLRPKTGVSSFPRRKGSSCGKIRPRFSFSRFFFFCDIARINRPGHYPVFSLLARIERRVENT